MACIRRGHLKQMKFSFRKLGWMSKVLLIAVVNKRHVRVKPRWPLMTNKVTLLFGTEPDFRLVHASASERQSACILKKVNNSKVQSAVGATTSLHGPQRKHSPRAELRPEHSRNTGGFRSWSPATCRFSTRRSFDRHGKGKVKRDFGKKKKKSSDVIESM